MPEHKLAMMVRALPEPELRKLKVLANRQELRNIAAWPVSRNASVRAPLWNDRVEADYKKRDIARLKRMGRNGYANWLFGRPSTCPPYLVRDGRLQLLQASDPAPLKSKLRHRDDIKFKSARHLGSPLPGAGQAETSFWNNLMRGPAWTLNINKMFEETEIDIIADNPITSRLQEEVTYVIAEGTETSPTQCSEHARLELERASRDKS